MRNAITIDKADKERQRFIDSIDLEAICRLASSYHGGDSCRTFIPPGHDSFIKHGSFNVCFFVEFDRPSSDRWVIRIPIPSRVPWIDEKVETELATMRYVAAKTSIPLPRVHAYSFAKNSPIQVAFVIIDYVEGKTLRELGFQRDKRWRIPRTRAVRDIYEQLSDIYIQLRGLEFPRIGALGLPPGHTQSLLTCDVGDICVRHRPLSIEIVMQELEGMDPGSLLKPEATFKTARHFVDFLFRLADNELERSPDLAMDDRGGRHILYARDDFRRYITDTWLEPQANTGPFVLAHGDLTLLANNILFDQDYRIVAVLDWEWSCVVPAQLLVPPVWLTGSGFEFMLMGQRWYNAEVQHLVDVIKDREKALHVRPILSQEWTRMTTWCHTAVAVALQNPDMIYSTYWTFLFYHLVAPEPEPEKFREYHEQHIAPRLNAFMKASEERQAFLARKQLEQARFFEEEKNYFQLPAARQILRDE